MSYFYIVSRQEETRFINKKRGVHYNINKIYRKKYTENFLNGHIHFTNYKKFREIEKEKIGDPKEVKITNRLNGKHTVKIKPHNSDISIDFIADGITEAKEPVFKNTIKIDCYSIVDEEYIEKEFKDNDLIKINLNTKFFEELERLEPDRDILICYNAEEFINRINNNINKKLLSRKIKYFPVNENPYAKHIRNLENLSYEEQHNIAIDLVFQKEYRLAIIDLDNDFISIGDIRDLFINITNEV